MSFYKKTFSSPEKLLLGLIIIIGLIFAVLVPPFQKPDENRHYFQAHALSHGILGCKVDSDGQPYLPLPLSILSFPDDLKANELAHTYHVKFFRSQLSLYPYPQEDPIVKETNWCSYVTIGYLPNVPGILIGRIINSRLIEFYLSRLSALLIFILFFIYSLQRTPKSHRKWLFLYVLTPMTLHQVSGINYDTLQLSLIPVIFSQLVNPPQSTYPLWLSLFLSVITKPSYLPMLLLSYITPKKNYLPTTIFIIISTLIVFKFAKAPHFSEYPSLAASSLQFSLIFHNPIHLVSAISTTLLSKFQEISTSFVGRFGWLDYQLPDYLYYLYFIIFGVLIWQDQTQKLTVTRYLILGLSCIFTAFAILVALYSYWTPVGNNMISGIQGRYFLPILPFFSLWLSKTISLIRHSRKLRSILLIFASLIFIYHIASTIYHRYWDYAQSGTNDIDEKALEITNRSDNHYSLPLPNGKAKLTGFYYLANSKVALAEYELRSPDCSRLIYRGYFQNFYMGQDNVILQETFPPHWADNGACLIINNLDGTNSTINSIAPLYLVPSLRD